MKKKFLIGLIVGLLFTMGLGLEIVWARPLCPPGMHWNFRLRECVPNRPGRPACPPGTHWNFRLRECVHNRPVCPPGTHWSHRWERCIPN